MTAPLSTLITYLEMTERPPRRLHAPLLEGLLLQRLQNIPLHYYLYLYRAVGAPHHWVDRLRLPPDVLESRINDPNVEVWVVSVAGCPAGFIELDFNDYRDEDPYVPGTAYILYFGLVAAYHGRRLGAYLMSEGVHRAFEKGARRIALNTNELDHPRALAFYQRAGFRAIGRRPGSITPLSDEEKARFFL